MRTFGGSCLRLKCSCICLRCLIRGPADCIYVLMQHRSHSLDLSTLACSKRHVRNWRNQWLESYFHGLCCGTFFLQLQNTPNNSKYGSLFYIHSFSRGRCNRIMLRPRSSVPKLLYLYFSKYFFPCFFSRKIF